MSYHISSLFFISASKNISYITKKTKIIINYNIYKI